MSGSVGNEGKSNSGSILQGAFAGELAGEGPVTVTSSSYVLGLRWFHHFLLGRLSLYWNLIWGLMGNRLWLS